MCWCFCSSLKSFLDSYCKLISHACCDASPVAPWISCGQAVFLNMRYLQTQHSKLRNTHIYMCFFWHYFVSCHEKWMDSEYYIWCIYHELQCISMYLCRIPMLLEPKPPPLTLEDTSLAPSSPLRLLLLFPAEISVPKEYRIDQWVNNNNNITSSC